LGIVNRSSLSLEGLAEGFCGFGFDEDSTGVGDGLGEGAAAVGDGAGVGGSLVATGCSAELAAAGGSLVDDPDVLPPQPARTTPKAITAAMTARRPKTPPDAKCWLTRFATFTESADEHHYSSSLVRNARP
jgi:hypothetical protein